MTELLIPFGNVGLCSQEDLNKLLQQSQDLSEQSKIFHKRTKKLNGCCKSW